VKWLGSFALSVRFLSCRIFCYLSLSLFAAIVGCGGRPSLDESVARTSLETALADWKAGQRPERLHEAEPPVLVVDDTWSQGAKLLDYKLGEGRNDGQNMHYQVELTLTDDKGKRRKQKVTYVVGTDPSITVFRHDE
jgi:hypothetical protein